MQFDIGVLVVIIIVALLGFIKGFWSQVISLLAAGCGVVAIIFAKTPVSEYMFTWLANKYPEIEIDINVIGFVASVCLFIITYFISGIIMEMIKRRIVTSFSIKLSDRMFGLLAGILKGIIIILVAIGLIELSKDYVAGFTSEDGYDQYEHWLGNSKAYNIGCETLGEIEKKIPPFSNLTSRLNITFSGNETDANDDSTQTPKSGDYSR